ncbi:MAG: gamma-glutamyl-gamma-aminobutyrate hydrolase family protein [Bacteroides sp.]
MKRIILTLLLAAGAATASFGQQTDGNLPFTPQLEQLYQAADQRLTRHAADARPVIGISTSEEGGKTRVNTVYIRAVEQAGGIPLLLPCTRRPELIADLLQQVDALILTGGADLHPLLYGEEPLQQLEEVDSSRDVYDLLLLHVALKQGMPILGICRGEQLCNVGMGGTLYQDLPSQQPASLMHRQSIPASVGAHTISIEPDSYLHRLLGRPTAVVNSFHHQAIKEVAPGLRVSARAADGVVEAVEGFPTYNLLAVQFHPEHLVAGEQTAVFRPLFTDLIQRAKAFRR